MITDDRLNLYEIEKNQGISKLSNRCIQSFDLSAFSKVGYPHSITSISDLWRFHDVMQENRLDSILANKFSNGIPEIYLQHLLTLCRFLNEFRCYIPTPSDVKLNVGQNSALISLFNLIILDCVMEKFDINNKKSVLEIGPGCGYLSLLNIIKGRGSYLLEASQAFYLYQHHLLSYYTKLNPLHSIFFKHHYWWEAADLNKPLPAVNIIIANHMLAEMHPYALRIVLTKFVNSLESSNHDGILIAEGLGSNVANSHDDVVRTLQEFGFKVYPFESACWLFIHSKKSDEELGKQFSEFTALLSSTENNVTAKSVREQLYEIDSTKNPDELFWDFIGLNH